MQERVMGTEKQPKQFDAILVAGEGEDSHRVYRRHKAFLKIKGKYIIQRVLEAIRQVPVIGDIYVAGPVPKLSAVFQEIGLDTRTPKAIHLVEQRANLFENAWHAFIASLPARGGGDSTVDLHAHRDKAVLIVPCDAPLITPDEVAHFIAHSELENYDYVIGLTPEQAMTHFYPQDGRPGIKMAYLHMKEKNYRINNLHMVKPLRVIQRKHINTMYAYRYQKNIINAILLAIYLMGREQPKSLQYFSCLQLAMACTRLNLPKLAVFFSRWAPKEELEKAVSGLMNTRFRGLEVPYPGAALDIDNDRDFRTMEVMFDRWKAYLAKPVQ